VNLGSLLKEDDQGLLDQVLDIVGGDVVLARDSEQPGTNTSEELLQRFRARGRGDPDLERVGRTKLGLCVSPGKDSRLLEGSSDNRNATEKARWCLLVDRSEELGERTTDARREKV
jgi:hypothetical protein